MDGHHSHFNVSSQPGTGGNFQHYVSNSIPQYDTNSMDPNQVSLPVIDSVPVEVSSQYYQSQLQQPQQQQIPFQFDPNTEYYYNPQTGQTFSIPQPQQQQFQAQFQQAQLQSQGQGPTVMFMQPQRVSYQANQQPVTMQMQPQVQHQQSFQHQHHAVSQSNYSQNQMFSGPQSMVQTIQDGVYSQSQVGIPIQAQPSLKPSANIQDTNTNQQRLEGSTSEIKSDQSAAGRDVEMLISSNNTPAVADFTIPLVKPAQPAQSAPVFRNNTEQKNISYDSQHPFNHTQAHVNFHDTSSRQAQASRSGSISVTANNTRFEYEDPHSFAPPNSEELIKNAGQMLMVGISCGDDDEVPMDQIKELITKYGVGNIILPSRHMKGM